MQQRAREAKALHRAGGECTDLAVQGVFKMELRGEIPDALRGSVVRKMIEAAEEAQVFSARKPRIEAEVASGMVAELAANGARLENGIVPCDLRAALSREQQRSENAQKGGFSGAIGAQ